MDVLLEASLSREVLAEEDTQCRHCMNGVWAVWRCKDCCLGVPMCRGCIRSSHQENPFHRIEQWNGKFFRPAELWEVGTYLLVRHHSGLPLCNTLQAQKDFLETLELRNDSAEQARLNNGHIPHGRNNMKTPASAEATYIENDDDISMSSAGVDDDKSEEQFMRYLDELREHSKDHSSDGEQDDAEMEDELEEEETDAPISNPYLPHEFDSGTGPGLASAVPIMGTYIRVVHTNGIHHIAMVSCECRGHDILPLDLLAARLLPASFQRIQTLFTAQLLDRYRLCNLELKASAYQFYHLLQRMTSPNAPAEVVNLYREFRRMSRIWRWMKRLKWAGYGNNKGKVTDVPAGQLSIFCPACPQPGINIPDNWKDDPAR
jgi:hypothetical protein